MKMNISDLYVIAILFFLSGLCSSEQCGQSSACEEGYVTKGDHTCSRRYPWNVALAESSSILSNPVDRGYRIFCGGTIISKTFILTAGHCFFYPQRNINRKVESVRAYVGLDNREHLTYGHNYHFVRRVRIHEDWLQNWDAFNRGNDLALLELQDEVVFSDAVARICLPTIQQQYLIEAGTPTIFAGFGLLSSSERFSPQTLQEGKFQILVCEEPNNICAAEVEDGAVVSSTCNSDSGGGLVANDKGANFLVGVVSWGAQICESDFPTRYVNIFDHLNWIETNTKPCRSILGSTCILPFTFQQVTYDECISRDPVNPNSTFPAKCPASLDSRGEGEDFKNCRRNCPGFKEKVNARWLSWGAWGGCSANCGGGIRFRSKKCTTPLFGGDRCDGADNEEETCNMQECAVKEETVRSCPVLESCETKETCPFIKNKLQLAQQARRTKGEEYAELIKFLKSQVCNKEKKAFCCPKTAHIYMVGGIKSGKALNSVDVFQPLENSWSKLPPMSTPRSSPAVAVLNNELYVMGGYNKRQGWLNTAEKWDPVSSMWQPVTNMSKRRNGAGAGELEGELYVVGGWDGNNSSSSVEKLVNNKWEPVTSLPQPLAGHGVVQLGGKIYAIGGWSYGTVLKSVAVWDGEAWREGREMNEVRSGPGVAVMGGRIYAAGGWGEAGTFLRSVEEFNTEAEQWRSVGSLVVAREGPALVSARGKLYAIGGRDEDGSDLSSVEEYDPESNEWRIVGEMKLCAGDVGAAVLWH